jgi:hypothetical protein
MHFVVSLHFLLKQKRAVYIPFTRTQKEVPRRKNADEREHGAKTRGRGAVSFLCIPFWSSLSLSLIGKILTTHFVSLSLFPICALNAQSTTENGRAFGARA